MPRIFFALALFASLMLAANIALGFWIGDFNGAAARRLELAREAARLDRAGGAIATPQADARRALAASGAEFAAMNQRKTLHFLFGLAAVLAALLVNGVSITYFIGASRWCQEVAELYALEPALPAESLRLKRASFPFSLGGVLVLLAIVALGAASDPSGAVRSSASFVLPHRLVAIGGVLAVLWSYWRQTGYLGQHSELIERVMTRVRALRRERGLPDE